MNDCRSISTMLALMLAALVPVAHAQELRVPEPTPPFPSLIEAEGRPEEPLWIAADLLLDVFRKLRRESVPPSVARYIRGKEDLIDEINDMASGAPADSRRCVVNSATSGDTWGFEAPSTLYELLARSHFAIAGRVSRSVGGFWRGTPANIITVAVTEIFKEDPVVGVPSYVNVPIFVGEITVGSARICSNIAEWPRTPQVGDEVFLFPTRDLETTHNMLMIDWGEGYEIIFTSGDSLVVPRLLGASLETDEASPDALSSPQALRQILRVYGRRREVPAVGAGWPGDHITRH